MKILNTAPMSGTGLKSLIETKVTGIPFTVIDVHKFPEDKLAEEIADADIVLGDYTGSTAITRTSC